MRKVWLGLVMIALAGCGNQPRVPDWQISARDSLERQVKAFMSGDTRVEQAEFDKARRDLESTGQPALVARAELQRCALRVATLAFEPCEGFERLRAEAPAAERAYAEFLAGRITPPQVAVLPARYHAVAGGREDAAAVRAIADPVSRLVAAGVLARSGRASAEVVALAADTASQQGWRRALLAWLPVQAQRAERAGALEEAQRLRRRLALVSSGGW
jgi:hypothetical protein